MKSLVQFETKYFNQNTGFVISTGLTQRKA